MKGSQSVEEAMTAVRLADGGERDLLRAMQDDMDKKRALFHDTMQTAKVSPETLRKTIMVNMTTRPRINFPQMAFTWMQCAPASWPGWYPDQCEAVAEMTGMGTEV